MRRFYFLPKLDRGFPGSATSSFYLRWGSYLALCLFFPKGFARSRVVALPKFVNPMRGKGISSCRGHVCLFDFLCKPGTRSARLRLGRSLFPGESFPGPPRVRRSPGPGEHVSDFFRPVWHEGKNSWVAFVRRESTRSLMMRCLARLPKSFGSLPFSLVDPSLLGRPVASNSSSVS